MSSEMKPQLWRHEQAQDRARLAGVGLGRQDRGAPVGVDGGAVEQDVVAVDEHEPEQRLDHVRVQDVVRPGEQPVRVELDPLPDPHVECGRQRPEVLAVADHPVCVAPVGDAQARAGRR